MLFNFIEQELKLMDTLSKILPEIIKLFALFFTEFGGQIILIGLIGVFYWCIDKQIGEEIGFIALFSLMINNILKGIFLEKRPYQHPGYEHLQFKPGADGSSGSTSFPSGHSQNSATIYTTIFNKFKYKWLRIICIILMILVPLSRVILGVHFPHDVVVGSLLGIIISLLLIYLLKHFNIPLSYFYLGSLVISIPFLIFFPTKDLFVGAGLMLGLLLGTIIEKKYIMFKTDVSLWKKALRILLGLVVLLVIKEGVKAFYLLFFKDGNIPYILDALRYFLIAFMATGVVPLIFVSNRKNWGI